MKRICVFCGSSPGTNPDYLRAAQELGRILAERNLTLVFGGARVGIMGQLAKAVLQANGEVIGVIPRQLVEMEVAYTQLEELHVVDSMHARKALMAELADGFIVLPGGLGTLEEFFEILTWSQLGMHYKPCGLLNTCRYYDRLMEFLDQMVEQGFVEQIHREMIQIDEKPDRLLDTFQTYQAPQVSKAAWVLQMTENLSEG